MLSAVPREYPARYRDANGDEETTIRNDRETLRMVVRGVAWSGSDFDSLEPEASTAPELLAQFTLHRGDLARCELTCEIHARARRDHGDLGDARGVADGLPPDVYVRACINCACSDCRPGGHGRFGGMACLRSVKSAYARVRTKQDLWPVLARAERVQEIDCCDEFARRVPGTGYRG